MVRIKSISSSPVIIAPWLLFVGVASAAPVTIDFENDALESQGFIVSEYTLDEPGGLSIVGNDDNKYASFFNVYLTVERTDGGFFSLHSYDYAPIPQDLGLCGTGGVIGETASGKI